MKKPVIAIGLALLFASGYASAMESYPPRDDCRGDMEAQQFRHALTTAVANRSAAMLQPLVAESVQLDFGGGGGWPTFAARLEDADYDLWAELDRVLLLGCAMMADGELALPWHWGQDFGEIDYFETMLVTGEGVAMRAAPAPDAAIRTKLDWEIVTLTEGWDPEVDYLPVRQAGGPSGYVRNDMLRSMVDYRLLAMRGPDGYRITHFIAGD